MAIKKPFFISFEGVEGSGKSTQAKLLYKFIKKKITKKVILTREPGGTPFAEKIRNILLDNKIKNNPLTEFFLLMAARNDHVVNKINYYLKKKFIIICDRFFYSTLAYQHYLEGMNKKFISNVQKKIFSRIHPDITFLIDLDKKESKKRISKRNKKTNRFDKLSTHDFNKIRNGFLKISKIYKNKITIINGRKSLNEIQKNINKKTLKLLNVGN
ncbi:MAG: dTMP kinase [Proteobacteria bacterium]|jgi:dTMP kinase|nr:dTMP kinase [Candidatus Fonsibacter sp. PEL5]